MRFEINHIFKVAILSVTVTMIFASTVMAQDNYPPRQPIEQVMREFQAVYHGYSVSQGNNLYYDNWPPCNGCHEQKISVPYPKDKFYGENLTHQQQAALVSSISQAFYGGLYTNFKKTSGSSSLTNLNSYTLSDFPKNWPDGPYINAHNYPAALKTIRGYINALKYVAPTGRFIDISATDEINAYGANYDCDLALDEYNDSFYWSNTPPPLDSIDSLNQQDQDYHLYTRATRGVYSANFSSAIKNGALFLKSGTACYYDIYTPTECSGEMMFGTPIPVPDDGNYHLFQNLSSHSPTSGYWESNLVGDGMSPFTECIPKNGIDIITGWDWYVEAILLVDLEFHPIHKTSPTDCTQSCSGNTCNGPGDTYHSPSSLSTTISLGRFDDDESAGYLSLYESNEDHINSSSPLTSLDRIDAIVNASIPSQTSGDGFQVRRDGNDKIQWIYTGKTFVDFDDSTAGTLILEFYHDSQIIWNSSEYIVATGEEPFREVHLVNPNHGTDNDELLIIEYDDTGTLAETNRFFWDSSDDTWELFEDWNTSAQTSTARIMMVYGVDDGTDGTTEGDETETYIIKEFDETVVSKERKTYRNFFWGRELVKHEIDPDGAAITSEWFYHNDMLDHESSNFGRLKRTVDASGYWEYFEYNTNGFVSKKVTQLGNGAFDDQDPAALNDTEADNLVTIYTYSDDDLLHESNGGIPGQDGTDEFVEQIDIYKNYGCGTEGCDGDGDGNPDVEYAEKHVSRSYRITLSGTTYDYVWDIQCASVDGAWNAADNLVTITQTYAYDGTNVDEGETVSVLRTNGNMSEYYEQTKYSYTHSTNHTTVITQGMPNSSLSGYLYGTRTTTVVDADGSPISDLTERLNYGDTQWFTESMTLTPAEHLDDFGRPTVTEYYFGAAAGDPTNNTPDYVIEEEYQCCGSGATTDRSGIRSYRASDALGRLDYITRTYNDGSNDIQIDRTVYTYDAAGQITSTTQEGSDVSTTLVTSSEYDGAGRLIETTDEEDKKTFYTYGRDSSDTYDEHRVYPHNKDAGPIQVTWLDTHGRAIRSFTATVATDWNGSTPDETATLTEEFTRTETDYDWAGRVMASRTYYDLDGTEGQQYNETTYTYTENGRTFLVTDPAGNITASVYDVQGRVIEQWQGTDATDATYSDPSNSHTSPNNMRMVSSTFYDSDKDGTGDIMPYATRSYRVRPISNAPDKTDLVDDYTYSEYEETYVLESGEYWKETISTQADPDKHAAGGDGPLKATKVVERFSPSGERVSTKTYKVDSSDELLAQTEYDYDSDGRLSESRIYEITDSGSGPEPDDHLKTEYEYDAIGRQVKVIEPSGLFTKTLFDVLGRVEATIVGTDEGTITDPATVEDDLVIEEVVFSYNDIGNVIQQTTFSRKSDNDIADTLKGRLSETQSGYDPYVDSRVQQMVTWYDDAHRTTHMVNFGTNDGAAITDYDPSTTGTIDTYDDGPPAGYHDTIIMQQISYDSAGRVDEVTDNSGNVNKTFYDDMGRRLFVAENHYDFDHEDMTTTGDSTYHDRDRVTGYTYNESSQIATQTAFDSNGDGTVTANDDQTTTYTYSDGSESTGTSPVSRKGLLLEITYPDSQSTNDAVKFTYYADGSMCFQTDQRQVLKGFMYDDLGHRTIQIAMNVAGTEGDQRVEYTYDDLGRLDTVTTFSDTSGTTATSQVVHQYDDFGNLITQRQDVDGVADGGNIDTLDIDYGYGIDDGQELGNLIHRNRLSSMSYPHKSAATDPRTIEYSYGSLTGKSIALGRIDAITEDVDTLVSYEYMGRNQVLGKTYPTPGVRLSAGTWNETTTTWTDNPYSRFDRLGRTTQHAWLTSSDHRIFDIRHDYDAAGNRKYADRQVYKANSQAYSYDNLNRLAQYKAGTLNATQDDIEGHLLATKQAWELDALGNQLSVTDSASSLWPASTNTFNDANEIETMKNRVSVGKAAQVDDFNDSASNADWETDDSNDAFDINTSSTGKLKVTAVSGGHAIVLLGDTVGPANYETSVKIPTTFSNGDMVGIVYGYKSDEEYMLRVYVQENGVGYIRSYEKTPGHSLDDLQSQQTTLTPGSYMTLEVANHSDSIMPDYSFGQNSSLPSGRVGVYTNKLDTEFDYFRIYRHAMTADVGARWLTNGAEYSVFLDIAGVDRLMLSPSSSRSTYSPILLRGLHLDRFDVVFSVGKMGNVDADMHFIYGAQNQDNYYAIRLNHMSTQTAPSVYQFADGQAQVALNSTQYTSIMPQPYYTDTLWYRIVSDGTVINVYCLLSATEPTANDWSTAAEVMQTSYPSGGMIGFSSGVTNACLVDDLTVKSDRDEDGDETYEVTGRIEHIDDFAIDLPNTPDLQPEYDDAGNMTYDGIYYYTYDVWNRLVKIEKAFRDPADDSLTKGSIVGQFRYDGLGRRIMKKVTNMVAMDSTYYYYYDGQRPIETRNGSEQVLKQQVWGAPGSSYVDELVQIALNQDPENADVDGDGLEDTEDENICERFFYVLQDANYNVLGLTSATGQLVERYEYTPYGQRTVHSHGWIRADINNDGQVGLLDLDAFYPDYNATTPPPESPADFNGDGQVTLVDLDIIGNQQWGDTLPTVNDPSVTYPRYRSFRNTDGYGNTQATPLCEFGHQGLIHDEEFMVTGQAGSNLIHNRARTLNPGLARFMQRDPAGFVDGMSVYQYESSNSLNSVDWTGKWKKDIHNQATKGWARQLGFPRAAAKRIADANEGVDHGKFTSPIWGDQGYHFDRNPGPDDSRLEIFTINFDLALRYCDLRMDKDVPRRAANYLGIALHPLQDWVAHGDYGVRTYPDGRNWMWHNSTSPQREFGNPMNYPDDPSLDAINGPNGRPAGNAIIIDSSGSGEPPLGAEDAWDGIREYAIYRRGGQRLRLTARITRTALIEFREYVRQNGGCRCRIYFGIQ